MTNKKCLACGQYFKPWPQTPGQSYCSKPECQRERRRRAKQKERRVNPESSTYQNKNWIADNPGYWKAYRANHPDYVDRNRMQQRQRNPHRARRAEAIESQELPPGRYLLVRLDDDGIANGDEWVAEIRILSKFPGDG